MRVFKTTLEPNEIFNPRGQYDEKMYISRPKYEGKLKNALLNDMCILVHGQSGTGKTWLTRSVLEKERYYYKAINLALASNYKSIYDCFKNTMVRENWQIRTKYTEGKNAGIGITGVATGGINHLDEYNTSVDYFMEFLKFMKYRDRAKFKKRYIVFENFECIIGNDILIKELTNLITIIDDDEVAKYNTNFIIIGATKDIHKYFSTLPNINTIENRIYELPEVSTLTTLQAFSLVERGFKKLEIEFENNDLLEFYKKEITKATGGIPQRLQELCLQISLICKENDWTAKREYIEEAKKEWITTSLNKNYVSMTRMLDYDEKSNSLKNKVLYCVAQKDNMTFKNSEVNIDLKNEFMDLADVEDIDSGNILEEFCTSNPPLLEKVEYTNEYSFVDFKYALCLRTMLYKNENEVQKYDWDEI
ncbi:TPA: AAA family ATPase [Clostridium botulinum]|nr:AAA family ATPase [Clostridium botulinum]